MRRERSGAAPAWLSAASTAIMLITLAGAIILAQQWPTISRPPAALAHLPSQPLARPAFEEIGSTERRKRLFFAYLYWHVHHANNESQADRRRILRLRKQHVLESHEIHWLDKLAARYELGQWDWSQAESWRRLLKRVDVVPPALALAQAANESGWGRSRFAREGHNYFGQWCFSPGCGIVPEARAQAASHEVARFASPANSVRAYLHNINTHFAYRQLRELRAQIRDRKGLLTGERLAAGLEGYSARGMAYVHEIKSMIKQNRLTRFDAVRWCREGIAEACPQAAMTLRQSYRQP